MVGVCACAPLIDGFGKLATSELPVFKITAGRYVVYRERVTARSSLPIPFDPQT